MPAPVKYNQLYVEVYVTTIGFTICTHTHLGYTEAQWVTFKEKIIQQFLLHTTDTARNSD